jgi:hypothetical protein
MCSFTVSLYKKEDCFGQAHVMTECFSVDCFGGGPRNGGVREKQYRKDYTSIARYDFFRQ